LGRGQIAPRPFSVSFVRKGGCSFEQPPFAIFIRFEQKGNQTMTDVLEHTGLKVSHLYILQAKQEYGIIERGIYLAEIQKRQVALMPI